MASSENEPLLAEILEHRPFPTLVFDGQSGRVMFANRAADRMCRINISSEPESCPAGLRQLLQAAKSRPAEHGTERGTVDLPGDEGPQTYTYFLRSIPFRQGRVLLLDLVPAVANRAVQGPGPVDRERLELERYRAILESLPLGVLVEDQRGAIYAANGAFFELLGLARNDGFTGTSIEEYLPLIAGRFENPSEFKAVSLALYRERYMSSTDVGLIIDKPHRRVLDCSMTPICAREGDYLGRLWVFSDATERFISMHELEKAIEAADRASESKSAFLANMSHEIRTPLNGILGFANLLLDEKLTPSQEEFARTILESGQVLLKLINDILDLSKVEAGKAEMEVVSIDLAAFVKRVARIFTPKVREKGLHLEIVLAPDLPRRIRTDENKLNQILINLIGNAVKFCEAGAVTLSVSPSRARHDHVCFSVRDTGIGIAVDKLESIFEPFTQAESSTSRKFGGTGLGLAITRRLIEFLGGEISVESVEGEGTTFKFTIADQPAVAAPEEGPQSESASPGEDASGQKFAVIGREAQHLEKIAALLRLLGIDVLPLETAAAWQNLRDQVWDAVLIDEQPADMHALAFLETTAKSAGPQRPVFIVHNAPETNETLYRAGAHFVLDGAFEQSTAPALVQACARWRAAPPVLFYAPEAGFAGLLEILRERGFQTHVAASPDVLRRLLASLSPPRAYIVEHAAFFELFEALEELQIDHAPSLFVVIGELRFNIGEDDPLHRQLLQYEDFDSVRPDELLAQLRPIAGGGAPAVLPLAGHAGARILLAEDNEFNQKLILHLVKKAGHRLDIASNGRECLRMLEAAAYDLVLMDLEMPEMNGFEAVSTLRRMGRYDHLPVIALSAHDEASYIARAMNCGCSAYICKPIERESFLSELKKYLQPRGRDGEERPLKEPEVSDGIDEEYFSAFRLAYLSELSERLDAVKVALHQRDFETLRYSGHNLKGTAGAFGLRRISEIGARIESLSEAKDAPNLAAAVEVLDAEVSKILATPA